MALAEHSTIECRAGRVGVAAGNGTSWFRGGDRERECCNAAHRQCRDYLPVRFEAL